MLGVKTLVFLITYVSSLQSDVYVCETTIFSTSPASGEPDEVRDSGNTQAGGSGCSTPPNTPWATARLVGLSGFPLRGLWLRTRLSSESGVEQFLGA